MAGEIIDPSGKPLVSARTEAEKLAHQMELVEKRAQVLNLKTFAKQISEGKTNAKEMEEILTRTGGKASDVADELKKIAGRTSKTTKSTKAWGGALGDVSEKLLGISLSSLTITAMLAKAVNTTVNWYNHTFEIKRQMYDINAALGEAGTKGLEFEEIISDTALAFHAQFDEVRGVADGLADIGMNSADIKDTLDDVFALTRMWSDITPEKQMSLMSDYMKEFGMNGKEAWATMNSLYVTSQDLRKDLPNLDIQKFVDQTQSVALSMRKYGLETQDAIAMTSTLARLGVEQARIPEIAERMGAIGLQQAPETAFMAQRFLMPAYQKELGGLRAGREGREGPKTAREVELERLIGIMNSGVIGMIGVMETASGPDRIKAQMGMFESMLGTVGVALSDPIEKIVGGLTAVDLPGIGKMNIQSAKEFAEAAKAIQEEKGISLVDALKESYVKTVESTEAQAVKDAAQRDKQIEAAKEVSDATIKTSEKLKIIAEHTGNMLRIMEPTTTEAQREFEKAERLVPAGGYVPKRKFTSAKALQFEKEVGLREISPGLPEMPLGPTVASARGEILPSTTTTVVQHELYINPITSELLVKAITSNEGTAEKLNQVDRRTGGSR